MVNRSLDSLDHIARSKCRAAGSLTASGSMRTRTNATRASSFATLRAFVNFLYSGSISFLPSLALFLADQVSADKRPRAAVAQKWLATKAGSKDISPVSPHALYRLADCYLHAELKGLAKNAVLEAITVESVRSVRRSGAAERG